MQSIILQIPSRLRFSNDKLFYLCEANRHFRIECYNQKNSQKLQIMMPTDFFTGNRNWKINEQLYEWAKFNDFGKCGDSSTGFILPDGDMLSPDASWVSNEKLQHLTKGQLKKFPPVCPDFVIEIMSKANKFVKSHKKMRKWMQNGCRLAFLLDFKKKIAYIYRENQKVELVDLIIKPQLSGENILENFILDLSNSLKNIRSIYF